MCTSQQDRSGHSDFDMKVVLTSFGHLLRCTQGLALTSPAIAACDERAGDAGVATSPHEFSPGLSSSSNAAVTPLCHGMGSLQLSARLLSLVPEEVTPASTANGDDGSGTPSPARAFSLPVGISLEGETPAFPRTKTGWNHSVCDASGDK